MPPAVTKMFFPDSEELEDDNDVFCILNILNAKSRTTCGSATLAFPSDTDGSTNCIPEFFSLPILSLINSL